MATDSCLRCGRHQANWGLQEPHHCPFLSNTIFVDHIISQTEAEQKLLLLRSCQPDSSRLAENRHAALSDTGVTAHIWNRAQSAGARHGWSCLRPKLLDRHGVRSRPKARPILQMHSAAGRYNLDSCRQELASSGIHQHAV